MNFSKIKFYVSQPCKLFCGLCCAVNQKSLISDSLYLSLATLNITMHAHLSIWKLECMLADLNYMVIKCALIVVSWCLMLLFESRSSSLLASVLFLSLPLLLLQIWFLCFFWARKEEEERSLKIKQKVEEKKEVKAAANMNRQAYKSSERENIELTLALYL